MEYLYYVLLVAAIAFVSLLIVKIAQGFLNVWKDEQDYKELAQQRRERRNARVARGGPYEHRVQRTQRNHTPTPWGWGKTGDSVGKRLREISQQRRPIDDPEWLARKEQSLRKMVEDRYGRQLN